MAPTTAATQARKAARSAPETAARIKTQRLRRSSKFPDIIQTIKDVGADTKTFAKLAETAALETIPKSQTAKDFRKGAKEACSSLKKLLNTAGVTEEKTLAFARLMRQHYAASFLVKVSKAINKTEHGDAVSSALRTALQQIETQQQGMPAVEQEHQDELAVDPSVSEDEDDEDDEDYMASEASDYESDDTLMDEVVKDEFPIPITYRYAEMPAPQHSNEAEAFTRAVSELSLEHIAQDEQEPNFQQQQAVHSLSKEQSVALVQTSYGSPESLVKKQNALNNNKYPCTTLFSGKQVIQISDNLKAVSASICNFYIRREQLVGRSYDCYARKSSRSNKYTVYDLHRFRDRVRTVLVDPAKKDNNITDALRKKVEQMLQLFCANNLLFFPELWKCKSMKEAYAKLT